MVSMIRWTELESDEVKSSSEDTICNKIVEQSAEVDSVIDVLGRKTNLFLMLWNRGGCTVDGMPRFDMERQTESSHASLVRSHECK